MGATARLANKPLDRHRVDTDMLNALHGHDALERGPPPCKADVGPGAFGTPANEAGERVVRRTEQDVTILDLRAKIFQWRRGHLGENPRVDSHERFPK